MPATAPVEIWPTNQVSVRLMIACRLLLAMSGSVSCRTARQSILDWPAASMRCAGNAVAAGAAIIIDDADFTAARVRETLVPLLADRTRIDAMAGAAASIGTRTGTENVIAMIDRALGR